MMESSLNQYERGVSYASTQEFGNEFKFLKREFSFILKKP